jgi:hypothetical protein
MKKTTKKAPVPRTDLASFFRPGNFARPDCFLPISELYEGIRTGKLQGFDLKDATERIQTKYAQELQHGWTKESPKSAYQSDKKRLLPSVCLAGTVDRTSGAENEGFAHSGLLVLDNDNNEKEVLDAYRLKVRSCQGLPAAALAAPGQPLPLIYCIEAVARSVSGALNGRSAVRVETLDDLASIEGTELAGLLGWAKGDSYFTKQGKLQRGYLTAISFILAKEGIIVSKDDDNPLKRGRYLAYDPELYVNEKAVPFQLKTLTFVLKELQEAERKIQEEISDYEGQANDIDETDAFRYAEAFASKKYTYETRHLYVNRLAIALNLLGIPQSQAEAYVRGKYPDYDLQRRDGIRYPYRKYKSDFCRWAWKVSPREAEAVASFILKPGQYVSDLADDLSGLIFKHGRTDLKAGTGSGKNYAVAKEIAPRLKALNGCRTVIVCSLNAKAEKDAKQYGLPCITGEALRRAGFAKSETFREAMQADVILCNQDSFPRIAAYFEERGDEKLNVFIDESQTLVNAMTYRAEVLSRLMTAAGKTAQTLTLMSGTPKPYFQRLGFHRIEVHQEDRPKIQMTVRHRLKSVELTALQHCQQTDFDRFRLLVKIQSKKKIRHTKAMLLQNGFHDDEVLCLYSDPAVKDSQGMKKVLEALPGGESFSEKVKVILCTSLINEGLDIYSSKPFQFVNIEKNRTFSIEDLAQFADRHRTGEAKALFSYHPAPDGKESPDLKFNGLHEFGQMLEDWQAVADDLNAKAYKSQFTPLALRQQFSAHRNCLQWEDGKLAVNALAVMQSVEALKLKHTTTTAGLSELGRLYPYFHITDERQQDAPTPAGTQQEDRELEALKAQDKERQVSAQHQLASLYENDQAVALQAVGMLTDDLSLKAATEFHEDRKEAVSRMTDAFPDVFADFLEDGERMAAAHYSLQGLLLEGSEIRAKLFQEDEDKKMTRLSSPQRLASFMTGLKIHLALYLFSKMAETWKTAKTELLDLRDVWDAKLLQGLQAAVLAAAERKAGLLTGKEIHEAISVAAGKKLAGLTRKQAVMLARALVELTPYTQPERCYKVGREVTLEGFLDSQGIDKVRYLEKLRKLLNINIIQ